MKTVVDSRKELLLGGTVPPQAKQGSETPKKSGLTIRLPPWPVPSGLREAHAISVTSSAAEPSTDRNYDHLLSPAQVEVLKALQIRSGQFLDESIIAACAASWAVDKHLIEGWLRDDQIEYAPPTPTSPRKVTPVLFLTPPIDRVAREQPHPGVPHQRRLSSKDDDVDDDGTPGTRFDELSAGSGSQRKSVPEDVMVLPAGALATDLFVALLAEAIQKSIHVTPISVVEPMDHGEFTALWPSFTHLTDALGTL